MSKLSTFAARHMSQLNGQSMVPASLLLSLVDEVEEVIAELEGSES